MTEQKTRLENTYVKDYYDRHVGSLDRSYTDYRWRSSPAGEFDHKQTSRALDRALGDEKYGSAIEIGPGDGVWTRKLYAHIDGTLHLVEQSREMLEQGKQQLSDIKNITYECSDWMSAKPPVNGVDLVFAIRCFEYFENKSLGLSKIWNTLAPGGRLILVTKNANLFTTVNVQGKTLHSDQVTKRQMEGLLTEAGFTVEHIYPATMRWKVRFALFRILFDLLHRLVLATKGAFRIPVLEKYATESYTYVASRPRS